MNFFQGCKPLGRLLFGTGLLSAAVMAQSAWLAALLLAFSLLALRLVAGSWQPWRRAWRVLRWLLVPIVLMHLLFTPGTLIFPQLGGGPSYEAVAAALWLSLRLCLMFASAMTFSRLLSVQEWTHALLAIPWAGRRLYPYAMLIFPMRASLERLLRCYYQQWRIRRRCFSISDLAALLSGLFTQVMVWSKRQGSVLWLRWGVQERLGFNVAMNARSWLLAFSGGMWCLSAAML
ncbi:MAG: hypothetical protein R8K46_07040 [Mariprofundaceae bacterium]